MEKNRKQFLDVARGLAIICIVLGHLGQGSINRVVFTFHVPIFFLISGYFISAESSVKEFLKKKIRTLIVPYGVFCLAVILSAVAFDLLLNHGRNALQLAAEWFFAALYGAGDSYTYPFTIRAIGALWFLLATFWGSVALRFLLERKAGTRLAAIAVIFALTKWSTRIFWFPLSIQAGGGSPFVYVHRVSMQRVVADVPEAAYGNKSCTTIPYGMGLGGIYGQFSKFLAGPL